MTQTIFLWFWNPRTKFPCWWYGMPAHLHSHDTSELLVTKHSSLCDFDACDQKYSGACCGWLWLVKDQNGGKIFNIVSVSVSESRRSPRDGIRSLGGSVQSVKLEVSGWRRTWQSWFVELDTRGIGDISDGIHLLGEGFVCHYGNCKIFLSISPLWLKYIFCRFISFKKLWDAFKRFMILMKQDTNMLNMTMTV